MNYAEYRVEVAAEIPEHDRCPDCDGHGILWHGYYESLTTYTDCPTCDGTGHA